MGDGSVKTINLEEKQKRKMLSIYSAGKTAHSDKASIKDKMKHQLSEYRIRI